VQEKRGRDNKETKNLDLKTKLRGLKTAVASIHRPWGRKKSTKGPPRRMQTVETRQNNHKFHRKNRKGEAVTGSSGEYQLLNACKNVPALESPFQEK